MVMVIVSLMSFYLIVDHPVRNQGSKHHQNFAKFLDVLHNAILITATILKLGVV